MIYLVQIPESYTDEQFAKFNSEIRANSRLNRKYEVVVSTYSGDEIKHTVLGDSFNKELYEAKRVFDIANNLLFGTNLVDKLCVARGVSEVACDRFALEYGSVENAIIETILNCFELEKREIGYKKNTRRT